MGTMIAMFGPVSEPFKHLHCLFFITIRQEVKTIRHMLFTTESNPLGPKHKSVLRDTEEPVISWSGQGPPLFSGIA